ncbi:MAG: cohesin domain-containing protein [Patescibacteria group bacterium]
MPKKTLALISGLVLVTIILFIVAFNANRQQQEQQSQIVPSSAPIAQGTPAPSVPAHSVLSLSPNPLAVAPGQQGKIDVAIDTSDNDVTAVQLELSYDPTLVSNVQLTPGALFENPVVLINKVNAQEGKVTYAVGITPNRPTLKGTGSVATITFTAKGQIGSQAQFNLLPTTLVTARGVAQSVLKSSTGTTIIIGQGQTNAEVPAVNNTIQQQGGQSQTQTYPPANNPQSLQ